MTMLRIVHMPNSRSSRIVFVAEELRIPYQIDLRRRSQLKEPDVLAINPFGAAPVVTDGDLAMMESMAIVQYLVERHDTEGRLMPAVGSPGRARFLQWFHYAEASLAPPMVTYLRSSGFWPTTPLDEKTRDAARRALDIGVGHVDDTLADSAYVAGDAFGAADIGIHWVIHIARMIGAVDLDEMKHVARYMAQIDARPAAKIAYAIPADYVREPPGSAVTPARQRRR
jgi:glutathione S-transferase